VEVEVLLEPRPVDLARALDVDPPQALAVEDVLDDLDVRSFRLLRACGDRAA
jgi:hypothetical protein